MIVQIVSEGVDKVDGLIPCGLVLEVPREQNWEDTEASITRYP